MPPYTACLVDVYETVLHVDGRAVLVALAAHAGQDVEAFRAAIEPWGPDLTDGRASVRQALAAALSSGGARVDEAAVDDLVRADARLTRELTTVAEDTVPFLSALRDRGVRTAFVSNCADNTRPLLEALRLAGLVDVLVLSCELGVAKPDREIYEEALRQLGAEAAETLFVDDQRAFCDGATALGVRAVRIDRIDGAGEVATLEEVLDLF